jgi:hypothetical protein
MKHCCKRKSFYQNEEALQEGKDAKFSSLLLRFA